jgi:uncharacterized membrane protein YqgA involved in biofilm formation
VTGTIINVLAILLGGSLGLFFGSRLPDRLRATVLAGLGLFTFGFGIQLFLDTRNPLIVVASLLFGALVGEVLGVEEGLDRLGGWLQTKVGSGEGDRGRFVRGFVTASVLFCVGPMAILGSIQDGLVGDYELLAVKSVLDGFSSLAFASTLGVGVLFSSAAILAYQGGISLLAAQAQSFLTEPMIAEMTATGGIIILGLAISSLLQLKPIRTGNLLPALLLAPLIVKLLEVFAPFLLTIGLG